MLGVGQALEEAVGGAQGWKSHFRPADERSETFVVAFAGFAEEYGFDAAAGAKRFFDQAEAFDADGAGLRGQTAAQRHAKFFEPAIVAAGQDPGRGCGGSVASGLAGSGHPGERSKFRGPEANRR